MHAKRQVNQEGCFSNSKCRGGLKPNERGLIKLQVVFIWTPYLSPKLRAHFTSSINTSIWLVLWGLAMCILASAACRIKTCKPQVFLQRAAKSEQKPWPHSLSLLFCPWLTRCQSRELVSPKSRLLLAPLCQRARLPIFRCLSVSVPLDTHTMPGQGFRRLCRSQQRAFI